MFKKQGTRFLKGSSLGSRAALGENVKSKLLASRSTGIFRQQV